MGKFNGPTCTMAKNTTTSDTFDVCHPILVFYILLIISIIEPRHEKEQCGSASCGDSGQHRYQFSLIRVFDVRI